MKPLEKEKRIAAGRLSKIEKKRQKKEKKEIRFERSI